MPDDSAMIERIAIAMHKRIGNGMTAEFSEVEEKTRQFYRILAEACMTEIRTTHRMWHK